MSCVHSVIGLCENLVAEGVISSANVPATLSPLRSRRITVVQPFRGACISAPIQNELIYFASHNASEGEVAPFLR